MRPKTTKLIFSFLKKFYTLSPRLNFRLICDPEKVKRKSYFGATLSSKYLSFFALVSPVGHTECFFRADCFFFFKIFELASQNLINLDRRTEKRGKILNIYFLGRR